MKLLSILVLILTLFIYNSHADNNLEFENWKKTFKAVALKNNISENTFNLVMSDVKFLPKVIEYDRYQPEFYEDTKTYISKRSSDKKVKKGVIFYKDQSELINKVEKKLNVANDDRISILPTYVPKLVSIPINAKSNSFSTSNFFSTLLISSD